MSALRNSLLILCGLTAFMWSISIPIWQYPDEQAHFAEVQNYAEYKGSPPYLNLSYEIYESERLLGTLRDDFGRNKYTQDTSYRLPLSLTRYGYNELQINSLDLSTRTHFLKQESAQYPPLYYVLGSFAYQQVHDSGIFTRVFVVRIVSVILFGLLILTAYSAGKSLFPDRPYLQLSLVAATGLHPMLMFVGSGVNNDILVNLAGGLLIAKSLSILQKELTFKDLVHMGFIVVLGLGSKQLIYPLFPAAVLAIIISIVSCRPAKKIWMGLVVCAALVAIGYIGLKLFNVGFWLPFWPSVDANHSQWFSTIQNIVIRLYRETLPWYWGVYRWLGLVLPLWLLRVIKAAMALAVVGWGLSIYRFSKSKSPREWYKAVPWLWIIVANAIYVVMIVGWEASLTLQHGFGHGLQGRYFFPLIITHMALLVGGWWHLVSRFMHEKFLFSVVVLLFFGLNIFSLRHVLGAYYNLGSLQTFVIQFSQYKPEYAKWPNMLPVLGIWLIMAGYMIYSAIRTMRQKETL